MNPYFVNPVFKCSVQHVIPNLGLIRYFIDKTLSSFWMLSIQAMTWPPGCFLDRFSGHLLHVSLDQYSGHLMHVSLDQYSGHLMHFGPKTSVEFRYQKESKFCHRYPRNLPITIRCTFSTRKSCKKVWWMPKWSAWKFFRNRRLVRDSPTLKLSFRCLWLALY